MNRLITISVLIIASMLSTGCSIYPEPVVITKTKIKTEYIVKNELVLPRKGLIKRYRIPKPIAISKYMKLNCKEKEKASSEYIVILLGTIGKMNYDAKLYRKWLENAKK